MPRFAHLTAQPAARARWHSHTLSASLNAVIDLFYAQHSQCDTARGSFAGAVRCLRGWASMRSMRRMLRGDFVEASWRWRSCGAVDSGTSTTTELQGGYFAPVIKCLACDSPAARKTPLHAVVGTDTQRSGLARLCQTSADLGQATACPRLAGHRWSHCNGLNGECCCTILHT